MGASLEHSTVDRLRPAAALLVAVPVAAEEPVFIVGADLDDDGQDDLLVTEHAAGDLNHDGKLDLAVVNAGSNTVTVFLANW